MDGLGGSGGPRELRVLLGNPARMLLGATCSSVCEDVTALVWCMHVRGKVFIQVCMGVPVHLWLQDTGVAYQEPGEGGMVSF